MPSSGTGRSDSGSSMAPLVTPLTLVEVAVQRTDSWGVVGQDVGPRRALSFYTDRVVAFPVRSDARLEAVLIERFSR